QRQQRNQLLQALWLRNMRFFKPEASTLQTTEQRFDFPSLGVGFYSRGGVMRRHHDEIFATCQAHPRDPQCQSPDASRLVEDQRLINDRLAKQSLRANQLSSSVSYERVLADANAKIDMIFHQPLKPRLADKLPVGTQIQDSADPEQSHKLRHQGDSFLSVGVTFLLKHSPQHRYCHAFVSDVQHQDIQRLLAELPIGAIQSQHPGTRHADQRHQQDSDEGIADLKKPQKSLDAFVVRFDF